MSCYRRTQHAFWRGGRGGQAGAGRSRPARGPRAPELLAVIRHPEKRDGRPDKMVDVWVHRSVPKHPPSLGVRQGSFALAVILASRRPDSRLPSALVAALARLRVRGVERGHGKTASRRALRARDGSCRGRSGRLVLQAPLPGTAAGEYRHRPDIRGVLPAVPEAPVKQPGRTDGKKSVPGPSESPAPGRRYGYDGPAGAARPGARAA